MDVRLRRDGGDSTSGAGQYLSSLLQLAFVISKLLLKTDLLKRGQTEKIKRQTERRSRQGKPEAQHAENTTFNTLKIENNTNSHIRTESMPSGNRHAGGLWLMLSQRDSLSCAHFNFLARNKLISSNYLSNRRSTGDRKSTSSSVLQLANVCHI